MNRTQALVLTLLLAPLGQAEVAAQQGDPAPAPAPLPPSGPVVVPALLESRMLEEVKVPDGFRASLFAGPPAAMYPTCLTTGPEGVVFVCVDPNLSLSAGKGWGKVVRLVDQDGDGRAERYTVFAEMDSPRGLAWDGETLYVMHPPTMSAYRDRDGDGVAEESTVLVEGIGFDLDFRGADHTTNGITLGIDGWIYVAVGDYGFRRAIGRDGTQLEHRGGAVVRVRPDGTGLELYATGTRNIYDVAVDPFARLFSRDNTNDGDGWNTRLHYLPQGAEMGYPALYRNFADEHFPSLHDYGGGSGTGALWIDDPAWPAPFGNTLYTADWTVNRVFRHPLRPQGASFGVEQEEFLTVVRPADLALDARGNLYVASLSGGQFTYRGDSVGYVFRISPQGARQTAPAIGSATAPAELLGLLGSASAEQRLAAQQEILRRGPTAALVRGLEASLAGSGAPAGRAAALYTLKLLRGEAAHPALQRAAADPALRAVALRAMTDHLGQLGGVPVELFRRALADADPHVQAAAVTGLARLGDPSAAAEMLRVAASPDRGLAHLAVQALVQLRATDAALAALDADDAALRQAALRVLQRMHDEGTVVALVERTGRARDAERRLELLGALARLYNQEGIWTGDWWTTRPAFAGPYYEPTPWRGSARIRPVLRDALSTASGDDLRRLAAEMERNRALPFGSADLLAALPARDSARAAVIEATVGTKRLDPAALPLLTRLEARGGAVRGAVVALIAAQPELPPAAATLARSLLLDRSLPAEQRGRILAAAGRAPGEPGIRLAADLFGRTIPRDGAQDEVEQAWRRYVGDRSRPGQAEHFITLSRAGEDGQRVFAYAVLVQIARSNRTPAPVRAQVETTLAEAWQQPAAATLLADAVRVMGAEELYAEQLRRLGARSAR